MTSSPPPLNHCQINTTAVADGSSTTTSASTTTPWSCETNWTVTRGSLDSAVTFESFDFPIDSESAVSKTPLLLIPPSTSDFQPCEIKLNFSEKHEIRQVYVRSTARNYEIYYATHLQSENEYLCTVRCSAASVEDNLFHVKNENSVNLEDSNEISPKERVAGVNNNNEDDWVEIKHPVGRLNEGNTYSLNQTSNTTTNYQKYYEATAEINDSEPCTSLTLRLLSLQSKAFVHIDEIYVFGDCIGTDDSQNMTEKPETSAGSSLMTMLVPTLLGLSKSRSLQSPDQHPSKSVEKQIETESQPSDELTRYQVPPLTSDVNNLCGSTSGATVSDNRTQSSGHVLLADSEPGRIVELTRCQVPALTSDKDKDPNTAILEQLVSRVTRIEDILLRFEQNMLKPINIIESRLHNVEQQLKSFTKNSLFPKLPPTSEPKPENSNELSGDSESEKNQVNNVIESPKIENPKKHVSIDDAMASALADFSSFLISENKFPIIPLKSPQEQSKISSSTKSSESEKQTVTVDDLKNSDDLTTSRCDDASIEISSDNGDNKTEDEIVDQDSIEAVKILTFDKNDILKYFPDQCPEVEDGCESVVDFETSILEVKFASMENGNLKSHISDFLSYTEDTNDEGDLIEETTGNGLLVELDGDDMAEGVLQDLPDVHVETSFDSLI